MTNIGEVIQVVHVEPLSAVAPRRAQEALAETSAPVEVATADRPLHEHQPA